MGATGHPARTASATAGMMVDPFDLVGRGKPDDQSARYQAALQRRLESFASRLEQIADSSSGGPASVWPPPAWIQMPVALYGAGATAGAEELEEQLLDVLWGQYALFLAVRVQDDLYDGHCGDLRLQFLADCLLADSLESFQRAPRLDGGFWTAYHRAVRDTAEGILAVDQLERRPGAFTAEHLPLHAKVGAIFHLATMAVCELRSRPADLPWTRFFSDQLAIASQIIDDLQDVWEDLEAGRFTFVGNVLLNGTVDEDVKPADALARLARAWSDPARAEQIWAELQNALHRAVESIPQHAPDEARRIAAGLRETIIAAKRHMHEVRVRALFGPGVLPHVR